VRFGVTVWWRTCSSSEGLVKMSVQSATSAHCSLLFGARRNRSTNPNRLPPLPTCAPGESKYLQNNPPDLVPTEDRGERLVGEGRGGLRCGVWGAARATTVFEGLLGSTDGTIAPLPLSAPHSINTVHPPHYTPPRSTTPAAARHVLEALEPYSEENGGPLKIKQVRALAACWSWHGSQRPQGRASARGDRSSEQSRRGGADDAAGGGSTCSSCATNAPNPSTPTPQPHDPQPHPNPEPPTPQPSTSTYNPQPPNPR